MNAADANRKWSFSVFFPCYNEEANVERTTLAALRAFRRLCAPGELEVIIVDDGSKDRTGEIADRLATEHPEVRAVHNRPNLGYGGALQAGFRAAAKEFVFYTDGDGQFDMEEIDKLLPLLERYDIVSAYRVERSDSSLRKFNAACWTGLVNVVFGLWLRDIDCAFKVYPRRLFTEIEMKSMGALIDAEVLARAKRLGYTIGQVGVSHYPRTAGAQTGANLRVILRAFKELFRLRRDIVSTARRTGPASSTGG
ncbi:MAG TPA: glycosyltransferase family 2 protein [Phycisphaerae bacterium]|nr:glycosyltransferase family 2 protein [Phycisphaerae bacterium]HNU46795.1 glycosyltransferase family 2 protein [Phycisphaerae bacterium]